MIITLLTDFGATDPYVGAMKGVIFSICPKVRIVDISHTVSPQNINQAAFILKNAAPFFPKNSIHLIVVDPGVGGNRKILLVRTSQHTYIAPDNGVLKYILDQNSDARMQNPSIAVASALTRAQARAFRSAVPVRRQSA